MEGNEMQQADCTALFRPGREIKLSMWNKERQEEAASIVGWVELILSFLILEKQLMDHLCKQNIEGDVSLVYLVTWDEVPE